MQRNEEMEENDKKLSTDVDTKKLKSFANGRLETNKKSYLCHTRSPLEYSNGKELNVISITLAVVIPMTLLAFSYTRICIKLWSRQAPGEGASQNQRQHSLLR